jgi:ornithine cyclodeaminase
MLFLNAAEVEVALPMTEAISAMKDAYRALSAGFVDLPLRTRISVKDEDGVVLFMPAYLNLVDQQAMCLKTVAVFPRNVGRNIPTIHAAVVVLNAITGQIEAFLEGGRLTAIRTGAASGAATDLLAREDSHVGAILGAGVQGRTQLQAICSVRTLERVWIFDTNQENAQKFVEELSGQDPIPRDLRIANSPEQAVKDADLICTATTALTPVFSDEYLKPGVHINGVGSYTPEMIEIPLQTIKRATVFVGSKQGVLAEAGEILTAIDQGLLDENELVELGEVIRQNKPGRIDQDQITLFKSVGVAVQDAAAAFLVLKNARKMNIGNELSW